MENQSEETGAIGPGQGVPALPPTSANIQAFLVAELARVLELSTEQIDLNTAITRYALDSVEVGRLLGVLQRWTGSSFDPEILWDYPTIPQIAEFLGGAGDEHKPSGDGS